MPSYPLTGVRVLEFEGIGPGPLGACMLADFGADVRSVREVREYNPLSLSLMLFKSNSIFLNLKYRW